LKRASSISPVAGLTLICSFITSPQAGAPTMPVPTLSSPLSKAADVARVLVVVDDLVAVGHALCAAPFGQCADHWMVLMSMPSLYMSHSGTARAARHAVLQRGHGVVDLLLGGEAADGHAQRCAPVSSLRPSARST
jgi:hypothetical protein